MSILMASVFVNAVGILGTLGFGIALLIAPRRISRILHDAFGAPVIGPRNVVKATVARLLGARL